MEKYAYEKCALPRVVLSAEEKLTALFDYAFKTAFRKVDYIEKAGFFDSLKKEQAPLCLFFSILYEAYFRRRMPDHRKMMICAGMPMTNSSHALYCIRHRRHR